MEKGGALMSINLDEDIRKAMLEGSEVMEGYKDKVWQNISREIEKGGSSYSTMKERKRKRRFTGTMAGALSATAALIIFFSLTMPGKETLAKFKEFFAPNKQVVQEIEGMEDEKSFDLVESSMGYVMYYDSERYTLKTQGDKDIIESIYNDPADQLPEVYMEIYQEAGKSPEEAALLVEKEILKEFPDFNKTVESDPLKGILLTASKGKDSKDAVVKYHILDNTKGGSFIIKEHLFVEAREGHGARFYYMLKEFKIVDLEDKDVKAK